MKNILKGIIILSIGTLLLGGCTTSKDLQSGRTTYKVDDKKIENAENKVGLHEGKNFTVDNVKMSEILGVGGGALLGISAPPLLVFASVCELVTLFLNKKQALEYSHSKKK